MLGHLPRGHAAQLAPLLDSDRARVRGQVLGEDGGHPLLGLDVLLTPEGLAILAPGDHDDAGNMLHVFLAVMFHSRDASPRSLGELGRLLEPVFERHVLPEAWLLRGLLAWKAEAGEHGPVQ